MNKYLTFNYMNNFKAGYQQAKTEIKLGLKPKCIWEANLFWIGYNLAVVIKK